MTFISKLGICTRTNEILCACKQGNIVNFTPGHFIIHPKSCIYIHLRLCCLISYSHAVQCTCYLPSNPSGSQHEKISLQRSTAGRTSGM
ncbi:hypothetical protein M413DRAFT_175640 [Hebeloma cylindrosporum]|uniref:Uncharacterized protein n=1 Tax=Hebeloma cylindrosporum TaxID=76867 RepID=A0A0C3C7S3_HEBCY|nr:hypothetical protein M413DRAFT_175640 [Hebeloma cylindrosporum h7]